MLVHRHFSKMTTLEINESSLDIAPPFTKAIISKLLILSGPNLKSLKVQRADLVTKQNILKIISKWSVDSVGVSLSGAREGKATVIPHISLSYPFQFFCCLLPIILDVTFLFYLFICLFIYLFIFL